MERLEKRALLAATPLGVTPMDTGEFLLGTVTVTPVLMESNGAIDPQTQDWDAAEIDALLAKVGEGVQWWSDMLDTFGSVHDLDFTIDDTFAVDPFATSYEPIDRTSHDFNLWVGEFVTAQGYGNAASIEDAVRSFNNQQRTKNGTDWAFTIFFADSSADQDGFFPPASRAFRGAYAFAGGLFIVAPSTRPASTIAHEMGHIFWGRDEYSGGGSWTDTRGYYNAQNLNAHDNPTPGFQQQTSIMRGGVSAAEAFEQIVSPESTLAQVGWRDSDGDGIFDLADVPLDLQGSGYFDSETSMYHFRGTASAVPLLNQNSSGTQSDITLNRISQLQYRLDGLDWQTAATPDAQVTEFELEFPITQAFSTIQWRVIDVNTGVTSPVFQGTSESPALSASSISGHAFLDSNGNGQRESGEVALATTEVLVTHSDGTELTKSSIDPQQLPDGEVTNQTGVTLSAHGPLSDTKVGVFAESSLDNGRVFHSFDLQRNRWRSRWSRDVVQFEATFDQTVGKVSLDATALDTVSFARVEAFDSNGQLIQRATSDAIDRDATTTVTITDPMGRIHRIRAFGHAGTDVALGSLEFGFEASFVTDVSGGFQLSHLPDGDYLVHLTPEYLIHQFDTSPVPVTVSSGTSSMVIAAAQQVDSARHNSLLAEDVNEDGLVTSRDALLIINDLARFAPRQLRWDEIDGFKIDVNNDGSVSALDALIVINALGRQGASGESAEGESAASAGPVAALNSSSSESMLASSNRSDSFVSTASDGLPSVADFGGNTLLVGPFRPNSTLLWVGFGKPESESLVESIPTDLLEPLLRPVI